jgi:hypothetical protein
MTGIGKHTTCKMMTTGGWRRWHSFTPLQLVLNKTLVGGFNHVEKY